METVILIPTPLRTYTDNQKAITLTGNTVGDILEQLTIRFPKLGSHLYNEHGNLRSFVNVYLNDEDIRYLDNEKSIIKNGDTVSIIPSIAGGKA
ncbi:MAG: MoaD/ThiS family protein [Candidatus Heimdallarchaeota archaeon]